MNAVYVTFQLAKLRNECEIKLQKWISILLKRILEIKTRSNKQYFDMKYIWYQNQSCMHEISLEILLGPMR